MSRLFAFVALVAATVSSVFATPLPSEFDILATDNLARRQGITQISAAEISSFKPFTFFASAAYCQPSTTINWSCGGNAVVLSFRHLVLIHFIP